MPKKKKLSKVKKAIKPKVVEPIIETVVAEPRFKCPRCKLGMNIIKEVSNEIVLHCPHCKYNLAITG